MCIRDRWHPTGHAGETSGLGQRPRRTTQSPKSLQALQRDVNRHSDQLQYVAWCSVPFATPTRTEERMRMMRLRRPDPHAETVARTLPRGPRNSSATNRSLKRCYRRCGRLINYFLCCRRTVRTSTEDGGDAAVRTGYARSTQAGSTQTSIDDRMGHGRLFVCLAVPSQPNDRAVQHGDMHCRNWKILHAGDL